MQPWSENNNNEENGELVAFCAVIGPKWDLEMTAMMEFLPMKKRNRRHVP